MAAVATNPFPITNPELVPAKRYYDDEFFRLEKEAVWPHVWQMACRLEEISRIGDYTTYEIFDRSVILLNTNAGVKAFHNACRHRGVKLARGKGNCAGRGFRCPRALGRDGGAVRTVSLPVPSHLTTQWSVPHTQSNQSVD